MMRTVRSNRSHGYHGEAYTALVLQLARFVVNLRLEEELLRYERENKKLHSKSDKMGEHHIATNRYMVGSNVYKGERLW